MRKADVLKLKAIHFAPDVNGIIFYCCHILRSNCAFRHNLNLTYGRCCIPSEQTLLTYFKYIIFRYEIGNKPTCINMDLNVFYNNYASFNPASDYFTRYITFHI